MSGIVTPSGRPARRSESRVQRLVRTMGARAFYDSLTDAQREALPFEWAAWRRPEQETPSGEWETWLILAGRGFGKTRTGAEEVRAVVEGGLAGRVALVGRTSADVRDVMVEGESGIRALSPSRWRPKYEPSKRRLVWPNGAIAMLYAADKPDQLRGPQHDYAWADELCSWRYADEAWANLQMGLRLGSHPRAVVTTTPRPIKLLRELVRGARHLGRQCAKCLAAAGVACTLHASPVVVTGGSTFDNAGNLVASFFNRLRRLYDGTRIGRQELFAEILDDLEGALWNRKLLEDVCRLPVGASLPDMKRIVVAMDPATTTSEYSSETGIIGAGRGVDELGYVLADRSGRMTPATWARAAIRLYYELEADAVVVETNNGGDLIRQTLHTLDDRVAIREVKASRGKITRAEPVSGLYEQKRWRHLGTFPELEDQMCNYGPAGSETPADRVDALVWAGFDLFELDSESLAFA